ncbi:MAG: four helix bundle protein [Chloroflexi bacterium]|nr:four helix bundle protein [Chloroflexota bacterium]
MSGQNYRDLIVWQKAMDLVAQVYQVTRDWPRDELYGLTNQVRRAVVSVPANVAEGQGRGNQKEFGRYLAIAVGSLYEVQTHLLISQRLGYSDKADIDVAIRCTDDVGRLLHGLMRSLKPSDAI